MSLSPPTAGRRASTPFARRRQSKEPFRRGDHRFGHALCGWPQGGQRRSRKLRPSTPVILLTGWGQRLVAEGDIPPHVDQVLNKPPKLRELREALAHACPPRPWNSHEHNTLCPTLRRHES